MTGGNIRKTKPHVANAIGVLLIDALKQGLTAGEKNVITLDGVTYEGMRFKRITVQLEWNE